MKKIHKFKAGDTVCYNNRGKNLVTHKNLKKFIGQPFKLAGIINNDAFINIPNGHFKVNVQYIDMVKATSRHPLTDIFADDVI